MLRESCCLIAVLILFVSTGLSSDATQNSKLAVIPSVEELVDKNVAARGGLSAWRAVQAMFFAGQMDAGKNMTIPFRLELKRPKKARLEIDFKGTTSVQVYDGANGWKLRPYLGRNELEAFTQDELDAAATQVGLDGILIDYAAKGYKLESAGAEEIDGHKTYKLKVYKGAKLVNQVWLDADSGLEYKVQSVRRLRGAEKQFETYYGEYKKVAQVVIPHVLDTEQVGVKGKHRMSIQSVMVNPTLQDGRFQKP
jgi:hypothetical protein